MFFEIDTDGTVLTSTEEYMEGWVEINPAPELDITLRHVFVDGVITPIPNTPSKSDLIMRMTVEVSTGKVFDGDEASQDRMLRAIQIASITDQTTTKWKMADNTVVEVTLDELKEALALAGQEMSRIWLEQ